MSANSIEKLIQEIGGMTGLQLSELVKALETTFGVSAAMPVAVAGAAASEAPKEEAKNEYKVLLVDGGTEKLKVIKAIRQILTTLGLAEAKKAAEEASDAAPFVIAEAAAKADAEKMKEALEAAGAKVKLS